VRIVLEQYQVFQKFALIEEVILEAILIETRFINVDTALNGYRSTEVIWDNLNMVRLYVVRISANYTEFRYRIFWTLYGNFKNSSPLHYYVVNIEANGKSGTVTTFVKCLMGKQYSFIILS
jgi:hypothetical protein